MGLRVKLILGLFFGGVALADHGNSLQSAAPSTSKPRTEAQAKDPDAESLKKLLNSSADGDFNNAEDRKALGAAAESFWNSLNKGQQEKIQKEIGTGKSEELDSALKSSGLVLSNQEKRAAFISNFQAQLRANSLRSGTGLTQLVADSQIDPKGDAQLRQKKLAAQTALNAEIEKNKAAVDYLKKYLGTNDLQSLMHVRSVESQFEMLTKGTPEQKEAARNYLQQVFNAVNSKKEQGTAYNPSNVISDLFGNKNLRESAFGKAAEPFLTSGLARNFVTPENPSGVCAGLYCAREMLVDSIKNGNLEGDSPDTLSALKKFGETGKLPATIAGTAAPSDAYIGNLANVLNWGENNWVAEQKTQLMNKWGLKSFAEVNERLKGQTSDFFKMEGAGDQIPLRVSKNGAETHAIKAYQNGLIVDPNYPGVISNGKQTAAGLTYSFPLANGSEYKESWTHVIAPPTLWPKD